MFRIPVMSFRSMYSNCLSYPEILRFQLPTRWCLRIGTGRDGKKVYRIGVDCAFGPKYLRVHIRVRVRVIMAYKYARIVYNRALPPAT